MKITYITHACLLIEIQGIKILTDPWLKGPSWGGSLWHYPTHNYTIKKIPKPDYIFFSHGHDDHFHEETIKAFPKSWLSTKILVANFKEKWWAEAVNSKFSNVKYLDHNETYSLNDNTKLQLFINDRGEPDCSIRIFNKKNNIFFQTDNLMSFKEAKRIGKIQKIDMAFVIPFLTGVFPGFYKWDTETLISLGKQKLNQSLDYCFKMITNLKPKYVVPYACDLGYLGEKFHINLIHTHNKKDLKEKLIKKKSKIKTIIMGSEDYLKINGSIKFSIGRKNENEFEKLIRFANEIGPLQKKYLEEERKIKNPNLNNLVSIFKKNLDRNIKFADSFNFKTLISINEEDKNKKILIDFKKKKINQVITNYNKYNPNLILNIESSKVRNLLLKKYPMNFLTFHNGGYTCERSTMKLTKNEQKYWNWINNLDFFI
jgi:UDP-MurNAc hydroxylase|tara:strand:+ start:102 stop:1388 length:1287 start_codon:yes stop_codon:yes gene_type:complete